MLRKVELARDRLNAALPRLQAHYSEARAREHASAWCKDYDRVAARRDELAQELTATYPPAVKQLVDLFERISEFDKEIDRINDSAPAGEPSRLRGVELTARDMDYFTDVQPPLAKLLQLPRPEETSALAFPPRAADFSVQASEMVARAMADRGAAYGPNWHEVREAEIERRRADRAAVQTLAERTQERSKQAYLEDQQRAARGE